MLLQAVSQPLTVEIWTWLFNSFNVLVIMLLLYKFLWKPIQTVMTEREELIENSLAHAADSKAEAEKLLAEYREQMQDAQREAQAVIAEATDKAKVAGERIVQEAEQEAAKTLSRAKAEIEREREKALAAIRDEVTSLVVLATGKLIGRTLNEDDHRHLVQEFVDQVAAAEGAADEQVGEVQ